MSNPPNPREQSNPTSVLHVLNALGPKSPQYPDPFNSRGVSPTAAGLTGESYLRQSFVAVQVQRNPKMVFLIMSFKGDGVAQVLDTVRDECTSLGFSATRADDSVGSDFVIKQIWKHIEKAELIVCDLTHERPNVYYELGYAHGVGNTGDNILLIAREETTLHFDIGPLRVHHYSSMESLRAILRKNLPEMNRVTTLKQVSNSSSTPVDPAP
jgi:hypothetical protein